MFVKTADRFVGIMLEHGIIDKSKEVVCRWGIMHMLDTIFNIALFVLIGISADMLAETALFTASYIPLRIYAGGYHAATPRKCCIISLIMLVGSLLLISHAERMLIPFYALAVSAALILIVLMPISDIHKPLGKAERRKYRTKGIAVLLTEMFFSVSLFLLGQKRSSMVLASVWISLSLMLIFGAVINACKQERRNIMKNKLHSLAVKFGTLIAFCAVTTSIITSNSTCMWLTYQPEEPEDIKALKKI